MISIHAELAGDQQQIVLLAVGEHAEEIAQAAKRLQALTPLFSRSKPPGALTVPATWAAVVQLSSTFGACWVPGPRLQAWINDQARIRTAVGALPVHYDPPAWLTPYPWQTTGQALIAATGRALITDEPGCISGEAEISINRNGKGFRIKLRDLVARFTGTGCYSGNQWDLSRPTYVQREIDGIVRLTRIVNAWSSGPKQTFTVTTETGRTVRATDEHPFLTERGWLRLDALVVGDLVHVRGGRSTAGRQTKPTYREVAGLYGHPHARGLGRRTSTHRVAFHRLVVEAHMNGMEVEAYIELLRSRRTQSLSFLHPQIWAVHHKDHDPTNNTFSNLQVLTHSDHHRLHAHEGKADHVALRIAHERVVSVEPHGVEETYDLEVEDDPHNFIADGFVVHNTGKTATAILGLVERDLTQWRYANPAMPGSTIQRGAFGHGPVIIVCPASVVDPWVEAWQDWAPHVRVVAWRGPKRERLAGTADVYVTSYETARADTPTASKPSPLAKLKPSALVIDECHLIKNQNAERSRSVIRLAKAIPAEGAVVALSGTPITHHPGDLWSSLVCMDFHAWPSRERWVSRYCDVVQGDYKDEVLGLAAHHEPEFRLTLMGQHRRVAKADVLADLPPKVYSVRTVDLPAKWRKAYDDFEAKMIAELPDGDELSVMDVLSVMTHLRSLSAAAADVDITFGPDIDDRTGEPKRHVHLDLKAPSWKVDALLEVLEERPDASVVTFAASAQLVHLAGAAAAQAGRRVGYVVGGQSMKERTATVAAFQGGDLDLICATTGAGGVGLTLTAASTEVFLQRPWSLVESLQAEDRCHRIGSERHESIEVIDIVARNTLDTRVRAVLRERAGQLADLVQDRRIVTELLGGSSVTRTTERKAS